MRTAEALVHIHCGLGEWHHKCPTQVVFTISAGRLLLEQKGSHYAQEKSSGGIGFLHKRPEAVCAEVLHYGDGSAARQHDENDAHATDMKQRHID